MSLETNYTKKELAEKIRELTEKLKEVQNIEKQVIAEKSQIIENSSPAVGMIKNKETGIYTIVYIAFDAESGAALISGKEELGKDEQIASYNLNKYAIEKIFRKARAGLYDS